MKGLLKVHLSAALSSILQQELSKKKFVRTKEILRVLVSVWLKAPLKKLLV
jgi:hypothetical protein